MIYCLVDKLIFYIRSYVWLRAKQCFCQLLLRSVSVVKIKLHNPEYVKKLKQNPTCGYKNRHPSVSADSWVWLTELLIRLNREEDTMRRTWRQMDWRRRRRLGLYLRQRWREQLCAQAVLNKSAGAATKCDWNVYDTAGSGRTDGDGERREAR